MAKKIYTGNRGTSFEYAIEQSCRMYEAQGIAVIHKRPTPVKIIGTRPGGKIEGFLEKPSTVDFEGVLAPNGRAICFEAKEIRSSMRFPLENIHEHQVEHLRKCHELGGISFVLIEFPAFHTIYLLHYKTLESYWTRWKQGSHVRGSASISKDDLDVYAHVVESGRVPVDFLETVRKVWGLEDAA